MVHYEFPLNEGMRTLLRLHALFERLEALARRDAPLDHHYALLAAFEIVDIAARVDLKGDLMRDLDRQRAALLPLRGHPSVDAASLEATLSRLDAAREGLAASAGKLSAQFGTSEFLTSLRSRILIPAGTCEFDLPAYHAWQHLDGSRRRADLAGWVQPLLAYSAAVRLVVELVRLGGTRRRERAVGGQLQVSLAGPRPWALARVSVASGDPVNAIPEISGHRLLLSVRWMRLDPQGHVEPNHGDAEFELMLCPAP